MASVDASRPNPEGVRLSLLERAGFVAAMVIVGLVFVWRSDSRERGEASRRSSTIAPPPRFEPRAAPQAPSVSAPGAQAIFDEDDQAKGDRVLATARPMLAKCLKLERVDRPDVKGRLTVTIRVGPDGTATKIELGDSLVRSPSFDGCVQKAFSEHISGSRLGSVDLIADLDFK